MYLNCHSYCSLRYGTLSPERLVELAVLKGIRSLALTDINSSMGIPDFIKLCNENKIKPIVGLDFRNNDCSMYIGIARNNEGLKELNEFLTVHNYSKEPFPADPGIFGNVNFIYPFETSLYKKNYKMQYNIF